MTALKAARSLTTFPVAGFAAGGALNVVWGLYNFAAAASAADTVDLCHVPAGATVLGGWLHGVDIDTGTEALDIDIGWTANGGTGVGASANSVGLLDGGVINGAAVTNFKPEASILLPLNGTLKSGPIYFDHDTLIQATIVAAANAGGTGILWLEVHFLYQAPNAGAQL